MAEETVVAAVTDVPQPEDNHHHHPTTVAETPEKPVEEKTDVLKEETNNNDREMKALAELKELIQTALDNHQFYSEAEAIVAKDVNKTEGVVEPAAVVPPAAKDDEDDTKVVEVDTQKEPVPDQPENLKEEEEEEVKKVDIDDDGTKTVEAIEETIVPAVIASPAASSSKQQDAEKEEEKANESTQSPSPPRTPEEVSLWGVPLMKDERTDTILLKFLLARDFRVKEAFAMIKSVVAWRKEFGIDELVDEDLEGDDYDGFAKAFFMYGVSKDGNPVCYNAYGAFQDKELYNKAFSDEEKRQRFLRWRIQFLERSVRKLDFLPGGVSTIVQVNDLKNSPGPGKWELRQATKQALHLLQDNYPEFVAKQVFINVPWWYMAVNKMISPFLTQRTKSKFVVAGPSKSAETLFSYVAPEQVPVQYGGLSREGEFCVKDGVNQIIVKPTSKETVEFAVTEACHLTWELRVLGWEVSYGAEFVPNAEDSYTIIIQKARKVGASEETVISNSFKTSEPGKVELTIDNSSSKKKRLLYRLKSKPSCD